MKTYAKQSKLLVVTQVVDNTHSVLGFFCDWLQEFEANTKRLTVIGQQVGTHALVGNITIASLGKEHDNSKLKQIIQFWQLIWQNRHSYDVIFVHMTPIWVILGWPLWFCMRKQVYLWYESRGINWQLKLATKLVKSHFSASKYGMPIASKKHIVVGHGINTTKFTFNSAQERTQLLMCVGRISPAKQPLQILEAFADLPSNYQLLFAGGTLTNVEQELQQTLEQAITSKGLEARVRIETCTPVQLIECYKQADLMMHMSTTPLDKVILEAMACGCLVVSSGEGAKQVLPTQLHATPDTVAEVVNTVLSLPESEKNTLRQELRNTVVQQHSLKNLIQRLATQML